MRIVSLPEFSEQVSCSDNKIECSFKEHDGGGDLSQDIGSEAIDDTGLFDNFEVFFQGTVGAFGSGSPTP